MLDIIVCPDQLVNSITTTDTFLSDHHIIHIKTCIPIPKSYFQTESVNPWKNIFEKLDFKGRTGLSL